MDREKIISAFAYLGKKIENELATSRFQQIIEQACEKNKWFSKQDIMYALSAIGLWLNEQILRAFCYRYSFAKEPQNVAVIMAGNIPAVGFADMLHVLLSGNNFFGKLSHQDDVLLPFMAELLAEKEASMESKLRFSKGKMSDFDAVIATGSDNSAQYFEYYFRNLPHIIRKNRYSVAVLSHNVNEQELNRLTDDVLLYFGLGCRSVRKVFVPRGFDLVAFGKMFHRYQSLLDNSKYRNNYEYRRILLLMNNIPFIDSGEVLLCVDRSLYSSIAVLNYEFYDSLDEVFKSLEEQKDKIQCIVSDTGRNNTIPPGAAQQPDIDDFADGVDTMKFLLSLSPENK